MRDNLADEGGRAAELGDGAGDVGRRAAGGLDEAAGLGQREPGHVGDEVDQHLAEGHHQVVAGGRHCARCSRGKGGWPMWMDGGGDGGGVAGFIKRRS
jgi:hypothetical protein